MSNVKHTSIGVLSIVQKIETVTSAVVRVSKVMVVDFVFCQLRPRFGNGKISERRKSYVRRLAGDKRETLRPFVNWSLVPDLYRPVRGRHQCLQEPGIGSRARSSARSRPCAKPPASPSLPSRLATRVTSRSQPARRRMTAATLRTRGTAPRRGAADECSDQNETLTLK
jgi:hypothetical protein